jgi:two-component system sensor histidine kinase UhpB
MQSFKATLPIMTWGSWGIALLLTLGIAFSLHFNISQALDAAEKIAHAYEVRASLADLSASLRFMEKGLHAFAIEGDESDLQDYKVGMRSMQTGIAELRKLMADNPAQLDKLNQAEQEIGQFAKFSETVIQVAHAKGYPAATALLEGKDQTISLRASVLIEEMHAEELRTLDTWRHDLSNDITITYLSFEAAAVAVLVLQVWAFALSRHEQQQRIAAESNLKAANERLESRVRERTAELARENQILDEDAETRSEAMAHLALLSAIIDGTNDFVGVADASGNLVYLNPAGRRMTGYAEKQNIENLTIDDFQPWLLPRIASGKAFLPADGSPWMGESFLLASDGHAIPVSQVIIGHRNEQGELVYLSTISRDIGESKKHESIIEDYVRRLASTSRRILRVQEQERRFIALELHDQIGQQLAALKINLFRIERGLTDPNLVLRIGDCMEIAETTLAQVRDMALDLRPSVLDNLGLVPALEWYVQQQSDRADCVIDLLAESIPEALPGDVLTAAFRIVQEAVNNALRHGNAHHIEVTLKQDGGDLHILIRDDGSGFDVEAGRQSAQGGESIGLLGMRERCELVGGRFSIHSEPGKGTEVRAELPLTDPLNQA